MEAIYQQIAQSRVTGTSALKLFKLSDLTPTPTRVRIKNFIVCNSTGTDLSFSAYHDKDGTTYDNTTALFLSTTIKANSTVQQNLDLGMVDHAENFAVKSSASLGLTYTLYGEVVNE